MGVLGHEVQEVRYILDMVDISDVACTQQDIVHGICVTTNYGVIRNTVTYVDV